jgi:hypothetical protein
MKPSVEDVLRVLNREKVRSTYGAVAAMCELPNPRSVSRYLGARRPWASWVVSKAQQRPTGYTKAETHADLEGSRLVSTEQELRALMRERSSR